MMADDYLEWITEPAKNVCASYGLPAPVVICQGAIESQWGEYIIGEYNLFGRKWGGKGNYITQETQECYDGEWQTITAKFQDYDSLEDAIKDWCVLMTEEEVYVNALKDVDESDPVAFINAIAGIYATDPDYADKVITTMKACDFI